MKLGDTVVFGTTVTYTGPKIARLTGIVFTAASVLLLILTIAVWRNTERLHLEGKHATGQIIGLIRCGTERCPVFRFSDGNGETFEVKSQEAFGGHVPGEMVPVLFEAYDPQSARIDDFWSNYADAMQFGIMSVVFLLLGIMGLVFYKRFNRKGEWVIREGN